MSDDFLFAGAGSARLGRVVDLHPDVSSSGPFETSLAVYVKQRGLFSRIYMTAIGPFRHLFGPAFLYAAPMHNHDLLAIFGLVLLGCPSEHADEAQPVAKETAAATATASAAAKAEPAAVKPHGGGRFVLWYYPGRAIYESKESATATA